jgi:hypothetical protein
MLPQQRVDVCCHGALVIAAVRSPRVSGTAIVRGDDAVASIDDVRDDSSPLPPCLWKAMQQHDRACSLARRHEVQAQMGLDISHAMTQ